MPKKRTLNISKEKFEDILRSYKSFITGTEFKNHEQARLMYIESFMTIWEDAYRGQEYKEPTGGIWDEGHGVNIESAKKAPVKKTKKKKKLKTEELDLK